MLPENNQVNYLHLSRKLFFIIEQLFARKSQRQFPSIIRVPHWMLFNYDLMPDLAQLSKDLEHLSLFLQISLNSIFTECSIIKALGQNKLIYFLLNSVNTFSFHLLDTINAHKKKKVYIYIYMHTPTRVIQ